MKRLSRGILIAGLLLFSPMAGQAQVRPGRPGGPPPGRQELEHRVMEGLSRIVKQRLGLSDGELAALQETMQSFREDRRALAMDQGSLRHQLRNSVMDGMSEEEARDILKEMVRLQEAELDLYRREQEELLKVLSPVQLVQFYRIRDEWGQRIQQMRQGRGPGGRGGAPGGVDPGAAGSPWTLGGREGGPMSDPWSGGWLPLH